MARFRGCARAAATIVTPAAVIVSAHGAVEAPPAASWLGMRQSGTHSPFPPCRARTVARFLGIAGYTAHPVRSFRSLVMAGGMVVDRFGPVEFIDARDRLPSVEATREPVPPVSKQSSCRSLCDLGALCV